MVSAVESIEEITVTLRLEDKKEIVEAVNKSPPAHSLLWSPIIVDSPSGR
jgi:hypothetical protein